MADTKRHRHCITHGPEIQMFKCLTLPALASFSSSYKQRDEESSKQQVSYSKYPIRQPFSQEQALWIANTTTLNTTVRADFNRNHLKDMKPLQTYGLPMVTMS